jgi:hypothetical protein
MPRIRTPHEGRHRRAAQIVEAGIKRSPEAGIKRSPEAGRNLPAPEAAYRPGAPSLGSRVPAPIA